MNTTGSIRVLTSPLIDAEVFVHGFPERTGGVSIGPRSSLNLGYRWGDDLALVEHNRRLLAAHVGFDADELVVTKHVHGTAVWRVGEPLPEPPEFDGLVSDRPGAVLGAFAADCIPMVFADAEARVCGAAHSGWRGTVAGVAANVVARMQEAGAAQARVRVALGPSIGPCCFEVGPEVVAAFRERFGALDGLVVPGPRKDHIDLRRATRAVLEGAGVPPENVDDAPPCTRCEPARFFSYRRDGKAGGVHMGFIGLRRG
jgi:polyphenol oxidase